MLRHRIIPVVLLDGYSVLKTIQFRVRRNLGNPISVARIYNSRNIDELILLDIDAAKQGRHIDYFTIQDVASECFMPLSVGGGIKDCETIEKILARGADKVVINSQALINPHFVLDASKNFGSQCIIVSVDVCVNNYEYQVYSHSNIPVKHTLIDFCRLIEDLGAGELFLNSVDRDGEMTGFDLALIKSVSNSVKIPIIACGGAGLPSDCSKAIQSGASAAAAASIFHFTDFTPEDCREELRVRGIPAR